MAVKSSNQITFTEQKKIVEIKEWYLATSQNTGITIETEGWTTDIQTIDYDHKYLWNYEEVVYSIGSSDISEPVIIGFYGEGRGISNIINYYQITKDLIVPDIKDSESWSSEVPLLSPTNKYLWNYEAIIYTNGSVTTTDPALIGVYGDSGTDAITFEIYSPQGFVFKDGIESIELKIAAFQGSTEITDATYTWSYCDIDGDNAEYQNIEAYTQITDTTLTVNLTDYYSLSSLKCTMYYNGQQYDDYVVLTEETAIYTAVAKFFNGSNIFTADDLYLIAYIELYKNNKQIETIATNQYCDDLAVVNTSGEITANISNDDFVDKDKMYFVYKDNGLYKVILGEYNQSSDIWEEVDITTEYTYVNSLYPDIQSNIIAISKEDINKSANINFDILYNGSFIISTYVNIIDSNDPIVGNAEPENPVCGQLWLDTSVTPNVLKMRDENGEWIDCSNKIGGNIFTAQPISYSEGDLWILAQNETCGDFGPGSMLKAMVTSDVFNESDWIDADAESTALKSSIKQYFEFSSTNGLKIGQSNEKFYVNINSQNMGFHSVEYNSDSTVKEDVEVVQIGINSAKIQNATFEGDNGTTFNNNAQFNNEIYFGDFVWKIETNGSLSLAIM